MGLGCARVSQSPRVPFGKRLGINYGILGYPQKPWGVRGNLRRLLWGSSGGPEERLERFWKR